MVKKTVLYISAINRVWRRGFYLQQRGKNWNCDNGNRDDDDFDDNFEMQK